MSELNKSQVDAAQEIDFETALSEAERLENCIKRESAATTVYSGRHPDHGDIHIIVPPIGNGYLLFPFAIRDF